MTDRRDQQAKLLAETFHEDWATGPAAAFARVAAGRARLRRRVRIAFSATGVAALMAVAVFVVTHPRVPAHSSPPTIAANRPASTATPRGYEIISDDQLLAQLRDRPLLVVRRENGSRQVVLLENE